MRIGEWVLLAVCGVCVAIGYLWKGQEELTELKQKMAAQSQTPPNP